MVRPFNSSDLPRPFIGDGILEQLSSYINSAQFSKIVVLTDENVAQHWLQPLMQQLPHESFSIVIAPGEEQKSIQTAENIWKSLLEARIDRDALLINLGGGVICDLGGFVAATYKRGISFAHIPTTLLAQVDASIGGKVGVNLHGAKNQIGLIVQPHCIVSDVRTLSTLPVRERNAGFAEIIKHALIQDSSYYDELLKASPDMLSAQQLIKFIERSCEIKQEVVSKDEKEQSGRRVLNFGHTIGHAIEAVCLDNHTPLLHGEAVSIGMVAESMISIGTRMLSNDELLSIEEILTRFGLPTRVRQKMPAAAIVKKLQFDKKAVQGDIHWTLLRRIGEAQIDCTIEKEVVEEALRYIGCDDV